MNKLLRLFMATLAGCLISMCFNRSVITADDIKDPPEILLTLFGFLFIISSFMFFGICWCVEWLSRRPFSKHKGDIYVDKIVYALEDAIDEDTAKKILMIYKSPPTEQEEYVYYKYATRAFRFFHCRKINEANEIILNSIIKLRDEKHEHYLILKLARIK